MFQLASKPLLPPTLVVYSPTKNSVGILQTEPNCYTITYDGNSWRVVLAQEFLDELVILGVL